MKNGQRALAWSAVLLVAVVCGQLHAESIDSGTVREGMHACPPGMWVVGIHIGRNQLLCDSLGNHHEVEDELVDTSTVELGMHACPRGMAMTGFHAGRNLLLCVRGDKRFGSRSTDSGTVRQGMHACPRGMAAAGIHGGNNLLLCAAPQVPGFP